MEMMQRTGTILVSGVICEVSTQRPQKVNVWAGIINNIISGPYYSEENLIAEHYLDLCSTCSSCNVFNTLVSTA